MGAKKRPFYRIVVADSRAPRDGRFIEILGNYDSTKEPAIINIDEEKTLDWMLKGAQPTDTVKSLLIPNKFNKIFSCSSESDSMLFNKDFIKSGFCL